MRKNIKYFLALIISFVIVLAIGGITKNSSCFAAEYNGFEYSISNGQVTINGYTGDELDVVIPSSIKGYPVTKLNDFCFSGMNEKIENNSYIESVKIPDSVTYIGSHAFNGCSNLESVEMLDSVTYIGNNCFDMCESLKNVRLSKKLTFLSTSMFLCCTSLESVEIPKSVTGIGMFAFANCDNLKSLDIPDSVSYISSYPFADCYSLEKVNIPNSLVEIPLGMFSGCESIKNIDIPNSVTSIGPSAFYGCSNLESIKIPDTVTEIDENFIGDCYSLERIYVYRDSYAYNYLIDDYRSIMIVMENPSKLKIENFNYPTKISQGNSFTLKGTISSNYKIREVKVQVLDDEENVMSTASKTVYPNSYSYSKIDSGIKFGTLPQGYYTYRIIARDESGITKTLLNKNFEVVKPSVTVGKVTRFKFTSTTSTQTLSWNKVSGASGYEIWMYKVNLDEYIKLKTITSSSTVSYKRSGLSSAVMNRYKVRAYKVVNGVKYYGDFTDELQAATKPLTPNVSLSSTLKGKIKISWKNISSRTTGYEIYRATSKYGTYSKIKTIEDGNMTKTFTNTGIKSGKYFYYKVRAYRTLENGNKVYSSYSTVKSIKCK